MSKLTSYLLYLLSCIINDTKIDWAIFKDYTPKDWEQLYILSKKQGVVAIIFDCLKNIPKEVAPPKSISLKWFSHSLSIENQMKEKENIAIELAEKLSENDIPVIVLKGLAYASYFPNSYHRESGDLDCYLMGKKEVGDKIVVELGGKMEEAGLMHSHLYYKGLTIENHKLLTSADKSKSSVRIEKLFQGLIKTGYKPIGQTKLLNPCADFSALFLLKHAQRHFIKEGICIRHLLDWAFFLKAESENVNWDKVIPMMEECRVLNFAKVLTSLCINNLKMDIEIEALNGSHEMSDAILTDIMGEQPDLFHENFIQKIGRIIRRFSRMWKFRSLAYKSYIGLVWESFVVSSYIQKIFK